MEEKESMFDHLTDEEKRTLNELSAWDAKIGLIYVASSLTMEREWHMALPGSVSFHTARISFAGCRSTECAINEAVSSGQIEEAAQKLGSCEVDVIAFGCTAGTFLRGISFDRELAERISAASGGIPTVTTSGSILTALDALKCRKVNVATPYVEELNVKERAFLEENGAEVLNLRGFQVVADQDIARVQPAQFIEQLIAFDNQDPADCLFISCTNSRSIESIHILESKLQKPVISSNQVALYGALKRIGYHKPIKGYGTLLEKYL